MAEDRDEFHRVGGNTDPKANPPSGEGPNAVHNPNETNRGNKPGQVSQEAGSTEKPQPSTGSGAPG
jgi:hypothetical protein